VTAGPGPSKVDDNAITFVWTESGVTESLSFEILSFLKVECSTKRGLMSEDLIRGRQSEW
jgi:hypothetical protein